jgi:hypothetical protein
MKPFLKTAIKVALLGGSTLATTTASASNKELLETLYQNGGLNKAQYEKLLKQETEKETTMAPMNSDFMKKLEWATRIKVKGDVRFRYENVQANTLTKDRERIRARIAFLGKVNDEVDAEVRIATGSSSDRRSTNQSLGGSFTKKELWLDRAFIDWHPDWAYGTHAYFGKMKQIWYKEADLIWDNDINPEGIAVKYTHEFADTGLELTAVGGYYILEDSVDGDGNVFQFSGDMDMFHAGLSAHMEFNDMISASLGYNAYLYDDEDGNDGLGDLGDKGNSSNQKFSMHEITGSTTIKTDFLPITFYGQYVHNSVARSNLDNGWLMGVKTKYKAFKVSYAYRSMQRDFAPGVFIDSDFNGGNTGARGHKIKLAYAISKNFSIGGAYFAAERFDHNDPARIYDTFQLDLKAKF